MTRPRSFRSPGCGTVGRHDDGNLISFGYKPEPDDATPLPLHLLSTGDLPIAGLFSRTSLADPHGLRTPNPLANALLQLNMSGASYATSESSTEVESTAESREILPIAHDS